jgi:hypothetical protein
MKIIHQSLFALTAMLMAVVSLPVLAQAEVGAMRAGIAKIVTGDVRVRDAQGERPLKSGDTVFENSRLVSAKDASASIMLRDGTILVLGSSSQFEVQNFAFDATTQTGNIFVNLLEGSMRMLTGLIAKVNPDAIKVKTKTLSVGVRGTDFIVETEEKL